MNFAAIERIVAKGESEKVELKKSTGLLTRAGQSLCAFLNDNGGKVIIGVTDSGKIVGQDVSDRPGARSLRCSRASSLQLRSRSSTWISRTGARS